MAETSYVRVSEDEDALMKRMRDQGLGVKKIGKATGRSPGTVSKHVFKKNIKKAIKPKGRPTAYVRTARGYAAVKKTYDDLAGARRLFQRSFRTTGLHKRINNEPNIEHNIEPN